MRILQYSIPRTLTAEDLEKVLCELPVWRRDKALSFKFMSDRFQSAKAYSLLKEGLSSEFGISGNPDFIYTDSGKPLLKNYPDIHFNLSHCNRGILCVVGREEVGCDMEAIPKCLDMDMLNFCFSSEETDAILSNTDPELCFTSLWTAKEAYLKFTGMGLVDNISEIFTPELLKTLSLKTVVNKEEGWVYSICCKKRLFCLPEIKIT